MNIDSQQLTHLLARCRLRDKRSFEALYQLTGQPLYGMLYGLLKDKQWAADILQEGFLKIWHGQSAYPVDYPWAWLCQCMRNLAIDALRTRARQGEVPWDEGAEGHTEGAHAPSFALDRCLAQLCTDKRNAIVLAYRHGLSHQEIVTHTQSPLGTVKSWIRRGLEELKQCLTQ
ncbi:RNA polymerase sigma factor [Aeromonas encheleia]|uniref:RNA polymerase sigma factor n=1 Tax=Aeromonas encheleia TaxID=73010 RepID=A0AAE9MEG2_9GAMM|nr:RNA polymerase sigma factor [Aeromonas encheleia]USV56232.1 RNA polymerase sigma factor [Aeromonas encheleia]